MVVPYSKIRPVRPSQADPYKAVPIPPRSVVRVTRESRVPSGLKKDAGRIFRIGYYGQQDGLDCIWLVNELGEYEQAVDHPFLFKYFDIIMLSEDKDLYGKRRSKIPPIRKAAIKPKK